jgi:hypothetical protein
VSRVAEDRIPRVFRDYVELTEVAAILARVCSPPNRRDRPQDGDLAGSFSFWFDGGACAEDTGGWSTYRFLNGDEVVDHGFCLGPSTLYAEIRFADGRHVDIQQRSKPASGSDLA